MLEPFLIIASLHVTWQVPTCLSGLAVNVRDGTLYHSDIDGSVDPATADRHPAAKLRRGGGMAGV